MQVMGQKSRISSVLKITDIKARSFLTTRLKAGKSGLSARSWNSRKQTWVRVVCPNLGICGVGVYI